LEWVSRKKNVEHSEVVSGFSMDHFVLAKMKEVHSASIRKGLPVPNSYEFMNSMIEGALEQYINQYGLRKVMNTLPKP
jgi:pyrroline-5-carboxylate reductase